VLDRDGSFRVYIGHKYDPTYLIAAGNVNHEERHVHSGAASIEAGRHG
jgi:hypothetical protein